MIHIKDYIESVTVLEFKASRTVAPELRNGATKDEIIEYLESLGFVESKSHLTDDGNAVVLPHSKDRLNGVYEVGPYTPGEWSYHWIKVYKHTGKPIVYFFRDTEAMKKINHTNTHGSSKIFGDTWNEFPDIESLNADMLETYGIK